MNPLELIKLNKKKYQDIAEKRSTTFNEIEKALEEVKAFIIRKKLIVYGGLSIDLSLKLLNQPGIYADDAIPDYDFFSSDFYNDSNELADILYKKGFINVSSINAAHFSSRRVRINFVSIADISYIPKNILDNIPYIEIGKQKKIKYYEGLRIVHPDFQRMDLHKSFNTPYANPPMEVILHRLEKDQKRFRLLNEIYPFHFSVSIEKINNSSKDLITISKKYFNNCLIGGLIGYCFLANLIKKILVKDNINQQKINDFINIDLHIENDKFILELPNYLLDIFMINISTDDFESISIKGKKSYYNRYLDNLRYRTIIIESDIKYEIFDINGDLIPCYFIDKKDNITIGHPNYILLYFLQKSFEITDENHKKKYRNLYISLLNIIKIAEYLDFNKYDYDSLPFFMPADYYGDNNFSMDFLVMSLEKQKMVYEKESNLNLARPPFGYYPEKNQIPIPFNIENNDLFMIDGKEQKIPFKKYNIL